MIRSSVCWSAKDFPNTNHFIVYKEITKNHFINWPTQLWMMCWYQRYNCLRFQPDCQWRDLRVIGDVVRRYRSTFPMRQRLEPGLWEPEKPYGWSCLALVSGLQNWTHLCLLSAPYIGYRLSWRPKLHHVASPILQQLRELPRTSPYRRATVYDRLGRAVLPQPHQKGWPRRKCPLSAVVTWRVCNRCIQNCDSSLSSKHPPWPLLLFLSNEAQVDWLLSDVALLDPGSLRSYTYLAVGMQVRHRMIDIERSQRSCNQPGI